MAAFRIDRLGRDPRRNGGTNRRLAVAKFGYGFEELLARAEGNAELLQILIGQLGEYLEVDFLLGENCREPAEPEPLQPLRHTVHHLPPRQRRPASVAPLMHVSASSTPSPRAPEKHYLTDTVRNARIQRRLFAHALTFAAAILEWVPRPIAAVTRSR